jgi:hypothetical protein
MPIMAVQEQNDARGTARLLAFEARRSIEERDAKTAASKVALSGLFRLLKAYRAHRLAGFEYQPRRDTAYEGMSIVPAGESHVVDLRCALGGALTEVYGQDREEEGLDAMEQVLRAVASDAQAEPQEVRRTTDFLGSLLRKL